MIRVRIAPSPTGLMHVGTARTALFNWLFARKNNGVFILRIEDTDKERSKKEYEESIMKGLKWLGLDWDEGPINENSKYVGDYGPYRQSERGEVYKKYINKLFDSSSAFWCYHTKEDLDKEKEEQITRKEALRHVCIYKSKIPPSPRLERTSKSQKSKTTDGVIRFKNEGGKIKFNDLVRGEIEFDAGLLGDFTTAKDEETPFYNLAAAIDDCEMKISHVIRGEDHISNTPKQLLIYNALGVNPPVYAHLPMILGSDKSKLSKRHGAVSLLSYKKEGYLADALFNFLALLGWSPKNDREILSREEIINEFSLEDVQKSGAVFNIDKLDWMNGQYTRSLSTVTFNGLVRPYIDNAFGPGAAGIYSPEKMLEILELEKPRTKKLSDITENVSFFFADNLEYDRELLKWKNMKSEEVKEILEKVKNLLGDIDEENFTKENLEKIIMPRAEEWSLDRARDKGVKEGEVKVDRGVALWPLRVALSGRKNSPGPFEIMEILGKEKTLARIRRAIDRF